MDEYHFDVFTALHDNVKLGGDYPRVWSRVVVSALEYPSPAKAADVACCIAVSIHGGMPVACHYRF